MAIDVENAVIIARPRTDVAAYAMEPDHALEWYGGNIVSVEWRTPRPLAIGTRVAFAAKFVGRTIRYTYEIVALVDGERLTMRSIDGPFEMETTYTFADVDGGTRMTLRNRGGARGLLALLSPVERFFVDRNTKKDLARIKSILERS